MASRGSALLARHRHNVGLLMRFGVVGVSGVVVNMITLIALRKLGPHFDAAVVGLGTSDFNLRWYHVYSTVAFLVANLCNFQLNRTWTFRSSARLALVDRVLAVPGRGPRRPGGGPGPAHAADAPALAR